MKPLTTWLLRRFGFRAVLLVNGSVTIVLLAGCGWLRSGTPTAIVLLILFLGGAGRSMELTSLTTLGFADVPRELTGSATALATMVQQLTVSVGIAMAAGALNGSSHLIANAGKGPTSFQVAFCAMALLAGLSLPSFYLLPRDAGAAVSGWSSASTEAAT